MNLLLAYFFVSAATILIDTLWLGFVAHKTIINFISPYVKFDQFGRLIFRTHYAVLCWLLIVFGIYYFVVRKAVGTTSTLNILIDGGLFGFVVYGVYDLTTAAIQTLWPWQMILLDVTWGVVLCSLCAFMWHKMIS